MKMVFSNIFPTKACKTPSSSYRCRLLKQCIMWELQVKFYLGQNAARETAFQWDFYKCNCYRYCHTKWIESEKEKYHDILLIWNLRRNDTNRLRLREQTYGYWGKGWREGTVREFGMDMYTLLYLKWVTNKDLLYSTWNSAQFYMAAWIGGEFGEEWIHVYEWLSPFDVHLKLSQHC